MEYFCIATKIGKIGVVWNSDERLERIVLESEIAEFTAPTAIEKETVPTRLEGLCSALEVYGRGEPVSFSEFASVLTDWKKKERIFTDFQIEVYEYILKNLKWGHISTYGAISTALRGNSNYSRAVGTAMNRNPFPIAIPCHRVLPKQKGSQIKDIGGFRGGKDTKRALLTLEGVDI